MTESDLDSRVLAQFATLFRDRGFLHHSHAELVRDRQGRQLATLAGTPDLIGCLDGRFLAFEDKVCPNRPTDAQWRYLQRVIACGGYAGMFARRKDDIFFVPSGYIDTNNIEHFKWQDEQFWNRLGTIHQFSILRAFPVSVFPLSVTTKESK